MNESDLRGKIKETVNDNNLELDFFQDMQVPDPVKHYKRKKTFSRGFSIAIAATCLIVFSSFIGIMIADGSVSAVKEKIKDSIYVLQGNEHLVSNQDFQLRIKDLVDEDMRIVYDLFPNLIISETLFNEYHFLELDLNKQDQFTKAVTIRYADSKGNVITTIQEVLKDNIICTDVYGNTYEDNINGGTIILSKGKSVDKGMNIVLYAKENSLFTITSYLDQHELIKFCKEKVASQY